MAERIQLHVTPWKENGWQVTRAGSGQQLVVVDTKEKAISYGRELAKDEGLGQLVVHKADGSIEEEFTYGDDPRDIPG
jgi:hypothetical protein